MEEKSVYLLFIAAILIHNIEEALWLPGWSGFAKRFTKKVNPVEFRFAALMVTVLALLCTSSFMLFPDIILTKYVYFGFLGAMMLNAVFPHLAATIVLKKYAPGLISAVLLNLPINDALTYWAVNAGVISIAGFIFSTIIVGIALLVSLPVFFKMGRLVKDYS